MSTATATKKVRIVRKPSIPVNTPVNLKVEGERTMRKGVTLTPLAGEKGWYTIHTGRRGRPGHVHVDQIVKVRPL